MQSRPQFGRVKDNVKSAKSLLSGISDATVVLPELFNTGYLFRNMEEIKDLAESTTSGFTVTEMKKIAKNQSLNLVFGMVEVKARQYFNSAVLITAAGKVATYQKVHLFDREKLFFKSGTKTFKTHKIENAKIGIMVCFDWIYPEMARILTLGGTQVICHPANLVLPWGQDAMRIRAIENRVFTITANRIGTEKRGTIALTFTGKSQIISPDGEVLTSAGERSETVKIVEIDVEDATNKMATPNNDLFKDRKVSLYKSILHKKLSV